MTNGEKFKEVFKDTIADVGNDGLTNITKVSLFKNHYVLYFLKGWWNAKYKAPTEKCTWIKYDYRTMYPKEHLDVDSPYWRIPEKRMETLKYCPYCGKEIEVEE